MDGEARVSAVVSILDAERSLEETVKSVFAQTFRNWKLLLIDERSTDGSTAIARGYAEEYPQTVRYLEQFRHRRRGQSASRNTEIRNANGEHIAAFEHDDVWPPDRLDHVVQRVNSFGETAC